MKFILSFLVLFCLPCFSQKVSGLEMRIYNTVDMLTEKTNTKGLNNIRNSEITFGKEAKTKAELLALVVLNCNLGFYENKIGEINFATISYEKAWKIFQKNNLKNYDIVEYCLKPLGNLYTILGDYDNAENTIKHYFLLSNNNSDNKIAAILNLSAVYNSSGKSQIAIDLLKNTIKNEPLNNSKKGILLNNLSLNYLNISNQFEAKKTIVNAINLLLKSDADKQYLSNAYRNLAAIYAQENNLVEAIITFNKAKKITLELEKTTIRDQAKLDLEEATLTFKSKNYNGTATILEQIFKNLLPNYSGLFNSRKSLYGDYLLLDALDLQAQLFKAKNQFQNALTTFELAFYVEDLLETQLLFENSKIIHQVNSRNRTEICLGIYDLLYNKEGNVLYLKKAFLLSEKTKSTILKNHISEKKHWTNEQKNAFEKLQSSTNAILKEQQKFDLADINVINQEIKNQNKYMLLFKSLQNKSSQNSSNSLDFIELNSQLETENSLLLSYFFGSENIYSFTIKSNSIAMKRFANANNLKSDISNYLDFFSNSQRIESNLSGFKKASFTLYNNLQLPETTNFDNFIIVPDGLLYFVPFEALLTKNSVTNNFEKMDFLLKNVPISYNYSVNNYVSFRALKKEEEKVLGVFPVFKNSEFELSYSEKEMLAIKKIFSGLFLSNNKATYANFKKNALDYSILHISTHASSGDADVPANIRFYDQEVMYSELYNLEINPNLIVLSACETGIGKWYKGEGAMSVARGFQFSGAQNFLFSLWKVNDYTTSKLMENFYENIHYKYSYSAGIQEAKIQFLSDSNIANVKKSPYYWAAFVYYGSLENHNTNYFWGWIFISVIVIGFIIVLMWKFRKRFVCKKN